jgi:hypothetical protein
MIGVVGVVRGLTLMIATEGIFVWCVVTPTSACKHYQRCLCTVPTLSTRRFKNVESPEKKLNRALTVIRNPLKVDFLVSRATYSHFCDSRCPFGQIDNRKQMFGRFRSHFKQTFDLCTERAHKGRFISASQTSWAIHGLKLWPFDNLALMRF